MPQRREGPALNKQTGYYFFDSYVGLGADRRRIRLSLHTRDRARATWLWEQEFKRRWSEHYGIKSVKPAAPARFADLIPEFIAYERDVKRAAMWKNFERRLNIIASLWGDLTLASIGRPQITALDQMLREERGVAPYTVNHYFGLLKTMFYWAIGKGLHPGPNPMKEIRPYTVDRKRRSYSPEEISKVLAAAAEIEASPRAHDLARYARRLVLLLLYTGMRFGEAVGLRWANVQGDKIALERTETKARREKVIPIAAGVREVLASLPAGAPEDFVFRLNRRALRVVQGPLLAWIRELSGVADFEFHGLRHTAATLMVTEAQGRGVGLADVMKILGHSKLETTLRYLHEDMDRMRKAVEIVEEKATKG